jgi:hypothetical protein
MRTNYPMQQSISDESQFVKPGAGRPLRPEEAALIRALVVGVYPAEALEAALTESRVADMRDGGGGGNDPGDPSCTDPTSCSPSDPNQPDPTQPDPTQPDPTQPDPIEPDPTPIDPNLTDPNQPDPNQNQTQSQAPSLGSKVCGAIAQAGSYITVTGVAASVTGTGTIAGAAATTGILELGTGVAVGALELTPIGWGITALGLLGVGAGAVCTITGH